MTETIRSNKTVLSTLQYTCKLNLKIVAISLLRGEHGKTQKDMKRLFRNGQLTICRAPSCRRSLCVRLEGRTASSVQTSSTATPTGGLPCCGCCCGRACWP